MRAERLPADLTTAEVMVSIPKTLPHDASTAAVREALEDRHVHMVLLTRAGRLVGTVVRDDVPADRPSRSPALGIASLEARTVAPSDPIGRVRDRMVVARLRRLAVVDDDRRLLGLLCLKRDRSGFCSDHGVRARAAEGRNLALDLPSP
ncbi:CBS domain protein [Nocardioides albertanoniae]|uniref:CBS domain protein n=1 Tax=Nocardioides albertanoniae TaxID=1175486 RepID=A0A543AB41_9ACTN|nr:CBS domain-containing protein [Nocardioides albertanoniae]TQL69779.1 CBS domain protein [Nocardioides albertanoniae]